MDRVPRLSKAAPASRHQGATTLGGRSSTLVDTQLSRDSGPIVPASSAGTHWFHRPAWTVLFAECREPRRPFLKDSQAGAGNHGVPSLDGVTSRKDLP
jgi:hypothetical protein